MPLIDIAPDAKPGFTLLDLSGISLMLEDKPGIPVDVLIREHMRRSCGGFEHGAVHVFRTGSTCMFRIPGEYS